MIEINSVIYRKATVDEKIKIKKFINDNFDYNLPLINQEIFFEYYYHPFDELQFVLAEKDDEILSAAGYIRASKNSKSDIWVSIWVAKKGFNGVGLELMNAIPELTDANSVSCNNIREKTCKLYRFIGWTAERVPHYYRLNKNISPTVTKGAANPLPVPYDLSLTKITDSRQLTILGLPETKNCPEKDVWYIERRYFSYPQKQYSVYSVIENGVALAYLILSIVHPVWEDGTLAVNPILRIVDFIGNERILPRIGGAIDKLLQEEKAEYIDCYCYGFSSAIFEKTGFTERPCGTISTIIPNYLNTILFQNTEYYFFTNHPEHFVLFKADGDQDRPR